MNERRDFSVIEQARVDCAPPRATALLRRRQHAALNLPAQKIELGATEAVITRPAGCLASVLVDDDQRHAYEVTAPQVEPVATVGSGDAFLAGFVAARYDGRPPEECLRFAVACGAESTQHFGAGSIDPAEVERLLPGVEARELETPATV